ncbi:S8 family serine peptidase [Metabacillus halosaccharovorans]|uniref:S8 family serine peptidase n=1 Tax=Metabacillus halosaccharovorans TaxID=930124 RepID=UPI002559D743|nr:S8 family serine peptidase [Metabacillus halosaccharovorans]
MMGNKIFVCILLFFSFIFSQPVLAITFPNRPPLPEVDEQQNQKIMVIVKKEEFERVNELLSKEPQVVIHQTYQHVFYGFSIEGPVNELNKIKENKAVLHASPIISYASQINESVPFIGGEEVRGLFDTGDHRLTGKGVKVAVIDTGIDYEHPDLHRNYAGGYDVIDGDGDPMETSNVKGEGTIHGTHVAGIIAANGKLRGMAPEAEIIAYRALGPGGMGTSDQVIAAIDRAIKDKVDIINLSLGNNVNGPDWPTSLALDRAVEAGIVAVTSSGNSGPDLWTVGSPGTSSKAITVGASSPPIYLPYLSVAGVEKEIPIHTLQGAKPWDLKSLDEIEYVGLGREVDMKDSIKGKIALIERGKIPFIEKVLNAKKHGAKAVIIFNNVKGNFAGSLEVPLDIAAASISKKDGLAIKKQIEQNPSIRTIYKKEEDKLADFSSRGPVTTTWAIKPNIVAPGVAIDSTVPDGYLSLHGTSMAAPHVAGACALIKQAHPKWTPEQIKASLMNNAVTLLDEKGRKLAPNQQGAGRINVKQAIEAEVLIYPGALSFGQFDTNHPRTKKTEKVTIDNQSNMKKTITFQTPKNKPGIRWIIPGKIEMEPGEKKQVEVGVDLTPSQMKQGIYEGWLSIQQDGKTVEIPYAYVIDEPNYPRIMGFEFTYGDKPNVFKYQMYLPGGADEAGIALYDPDSLTFVGYLDWLQKAPRGLIGGEINAEEMKVPKGDYKAIIFAKKNGQENYLETDILLGE